MAAPLRTASITAPAFYGLNTMDSEVTLDPKFARSAENCIIDEGGRIGSRKGWQYVAQTDPVSTVDLKGMHRFIDIDGQEYFGTWSTDNFYIKNGGDLDEVFVNKHTLTAGSLTSSGTTATVAFTNHNYETGDQIIISGATQTEYNGTYTITKINANSFSYTFAGSATTPATGTITTSLYVNTAGNWQAATLNDAAYLFERGEAPMYFSPTTGELDLIINVNKTISPPQANTVLSAYGRIWVADTPTNKTTVYWSDLLDGTEWDPNVGTVGSLDISGILVHGNDEIVGLGAHNGYLIIFCKNNIVIMGDGDAEKQYLTPANMSLVEVINGVGCIARDTIVNTGTDILFLSEAGVRSLGRTIQEKSQPVRDISRNIRDTLVDEVSRADKTKIKAVYSDHFAFYLLSIPEEKTVYCFDMRAPLQNGSARVTRWNGLDHTSWLAFDGSMYMTNTQGMAEYTGYQDNGSSYQMQYYTNYFDFGMQNLIKIVKNVAATVIGSTGQKFVTKIGTNYEDIYTSYPLVVKEGAVAEYNIDEYNTTAEYSAGALIDNIRIPAGGSGFVIQLGFESTINGGFLNIQQIDLYVKQGRLN